jgi:hypothetical protein
MKQTIISVLLALAFASSAMALSDLIGARTEADRSRGGRHLARCAIYLAGAALVANLL